MFKDKEPKKINDADGLFISARQLSGLMAAALPCVFFIFIGGYFLGKSHIVEPFVTKIEHDSFADQIYASICAIANQDTALGESKSEECENVQIAQGSEKEEIETLQIQKIENGENPPAEMSRIPAEKNSVKNQKSWYAELIGFGHKQEKTAVAFAHKLQKKGIAVKIKTIPSVTPKGQTKKWYQVITEPYTDRDNLQAIVDKVAHEEKLKGVKIRSC